MNTTEGKKIIHTDKAPAAIGPYSQAVRAGDMVYTAGQIGLDPATMEIVSGGVEASKGIKDAKAIEQFLRGVQLGDRDYE